ncbi:multidrug effflux MFS transporter [Actinotalea sp. M2MS4P-6]|uniref:multidrug effflux MFS transporter n=1 Tax=Actinotalea sp. M2MS4P-6 TaxID=2983762 RepID=UPI0021E3FEEF|nr:multidrug effflux MFS transporter [Actinotalea sp. M2MS4P-6]MCV2393523.1 multidrug effflux MFS transporter [Actinotalea sp. M2MS4P-6]
MPHEPAGSAVPARGRTAVTGAAPRGGTALFVFLTGTLAMLPAVSIDIYLPSLPRVAEDLGTTVAGAQFTVTGLVMGLAVGQLVMGPWSDRVGRRTPAITGLAAQLVLSLLCAIAPSIAVLSALRVLQGFTAAAANVVSMATIRDRFTGADAARLMSRLMLVIVAAPLFAPTIGSLVAAHWGWRAVFVVVAGVAAVVLVIVIVALPETLPPERRRRQRPLALARGYLALLQDRRFMAFAIIPGLAQAVIMAYVSGSSFVLQEQFGLSAQSFAFVFALGGIAIVIGTQTNAALVRRAGPARLLRSAAPLAVLGAGAMLLVALADLGRVAALLTPLWLTLMMLGFVTANASALALSRHGERAGTAAATIGFLQGGVAGAIGSTVGLLGGDAVAMSSVILASTLLVTGVLAFATPAYRRDGWIAMGADPEALAD